MHFNIKSIFFLAFSFFDNYKLNMLFNLKDYSKRMGSKCRGLKRKF